MENREVKVTIAEPAGLGLAGLAMVTLVASSQKLGLTSGVSFILPWAIFMGAFAQLYASIVDAKRNNIFGATAFGAYAFFWLGVSLCWMIQAGFLGEQLAAAVDPKELGVAFVGYLIFSLYMTVGSLKTHKVLFSIFVAIDFLFLGLIIYSFNIFGLKAFGGGLAAISEFIISMLSFYGSAATVLNSQFGKVILPVGKPFEFGSDIIDELENKEAAIA